MNEKHFSDGSEALNGIKHTLFYRCCMVIVAVMAVISAVLIWRTVHTGMNLTTVCTSVMTMAGMIVLLFRNRLRYTAVAHVLVMFFIAGGFAAIWSIGIFFNVMTFVTALVFSIVFLKKRDTAVYALMVTAGITAGSVIYSTGIRKYDFDLGAFATSPASWIVIVIYAVLFSVVLFLVVGAFQDRLMETVEAIGKSEKGLLQREQRLLGIANSIPGMLYSFYVRNTGEMGLYYVSHRSDEIFGIASDHPDYFARFRDCVVGEQRESFVNSIKDATAQFHRWEFEGIFQRPDGTKINFLGISHPERRENETVFSGVLLDITERKKLDVELLEILSNLRRSQEMGRIGDWKLNLSDMKFSASDTALEIMGFESGSTPTFREVSSLMVPEDRLRAREVMQRALETGEPYDIEIRVIRKDNGELRHLISHAEVDRDQTGRQKMLFGINLDITRRKLAEEALAQSERKYRLIAENATDVIFTMDMGFKINYVSPSILKTSGFTPEQIMALPWDRLMTADSLARVMDAADRAVKALAAGDKRFKIILELEEYNADGSTRWTENELTYMLDESEMPVGVIGVSRHIDERKKAEERINASLAEKELLLRELYHRTKNNMQVICALLELKSDESGQKPIREVFTEIVTKIRTMALVHQGLYQSSDLESINLREYLSDIAELFRSGSPTMPAGVKINLDVENIRITIDTAIPLGLIINELITNSCKHGFLSGSGGIWLSVKSDESFITISYRDDGVGIEAGVDTESHGGLGMQLLDQIVSKQLQGNLEILAGKGFRCNITVRKDLYRSRLESR